MSSFLTLLFIPFFVSVEAKKENIVESKKSNQADF